jgi:hypothetical protein
LTTLAPDGVDTARFNHDDCPAGTDTKRRLYITRKEDGIIVGYCHNCGSSGVAVGSGSTYKRTAAIVTDTKVKEVTMPPNIEFEPKLWPKEAIDWVQKAGLPLTTVKKYALAYDLDSRRVLIPKYDVDNRLVMWQSRRVHDDLELTPKYITEVQIDACVHDPLGTRGEVVVLCEDMLSAIKIDALAGYDVIPLFSSNVKIDKLLTPTAKYDTIVVWLDNDNTEVKRHRDSIARQLRSLGKRVEVITRLSDPKHRHESLIIEAIEDVLIKF